MKTAARLAFIRAGTLGLLAGLMLLGPLAGCSRFDLLNATVPGRGYVRTEDIAYGPSNRQRLDIYRPRKADTPAAIVIFFYGGDWQYGSKSDYRFVGQALSSQGFIAILPDYRLYPAVTFPAFVEDGAMAIRWARDHAASIGGDPSRIFLMGHSAGAHIAALLTLDPRYLEAVGLDRSAILATAALSGPYEFEPPSYDKGVFELEGGAFDPSADFQPINFVDGKAPPMLLVHGMEDDVVRPANATRLAERIREKGGDVRTALYAGRGHVGVALSLAWSFRSLAPTLRDVTDFFREIDRGRTAR